MNAPADQPVEPSRLAVPRSWTPAPSPFATTPTRIAVEWPALPGVALSDLSAQAARPVPRAEFVDSAVELLTSIGDQEAHLTPWSLRWTDAGLAALVIPGMRLGQQDWPHPFQEMPPTGVAADLYVLGITTFRILSGRWPADREDALVTSGVLAGHWPLGAEVLVRQCLGASADDPPSAGEVAQLVAAFTRPPDRTDLDLDCIRAAEESVVGWRKAAGRLGGDNEDAVAWSRTDQSVVGAVLDGVTAGGDGSGRWAAHSMVALIHQGWDAGIHEPTALIRRAHQQLGEPPTPFAMDPCATAITVCVTTDSVARIGSVGDSRAYLVRHVEGRPVATRLTPEDSATADALRCGRAPETRDAGVLTAAVGRRELPDVHTRDVPVQDGDYLVVVTDGACRADPTDSGERAWRFIEILESMSASHPPPGLLASRLCRAAEELGGQDNATALVLCVRTAPDEPGTLRPASLLRLIAHAFTGSGGA